MGSRSHSVVRAPRADGSREPIRIDEIEGLVKADSDLELIQDAVGVDPSTGRQLRLGVLIWWTAHPDGPVPLVLVRGEIQVTDADQATLNKLADMAGKLDAHVQDDVARSLLR